MEFFNKALSYFNFGSDLRKWIKIFCNEITSCVMNNGHSTAFFPIERGARQGDPISPYLFIIAVEILSAAIKNNENIQGITIEETETVISQLADDTDLFLDDDPISLRTSINLINDFKECSGLSLNTEKSKIFWVGPNASGR